MIILIIHIIVSYDRNISLIFVCERWIPCQAVTSVLCWHYRPETVHCSTKDGYTSEITFLALHPWPNLCHHRHIFITGYWRGSPRLVSIRSYGAQFLVSSIEIVNIHIHYLAHYLSIHLFNLIVSQFMQVSVTLLVSSIEIVNTHIHYLAHYLSIQI